MGTFLHSPPKLGAGGRREEGVAESRFSKSFPKVPEERYDRKTLMGVII
jgi:hypothetical protein